MYLKWYFTFFTLSPQQTKDCQRTPELLFVVVIFLPFTCKHLPSVCVFAQVYDESSILSHNAYIPVVALEKSMHICSVS